MGKRQDMSAETNPPARGQGGRAATGWGTFPLGSIAGVRIAVNWSVLVIFGLIAYGLAAEWFPDRYAGRGTGAYVTAALLTAIAFFVSLLAHEISHALVARRNGQQVEGITLWLLGGVARLHGEARSPAVELRVAGVGPLVSLIIGALCLVGTVVLAVFGTGGLVVAAVGWLATINVALAVFNSIPAAPLDGGRLLRAFLWWRTGDATRAAVWSSRAGQVFGWVLVAVGLLSLFSTGQFGALWLAIIGWFLITASSMEGQQAAARGRLAGIPVWQVMTPEPVTVPAAMTAQEFLDSYVMRHRHTAFPVTGEEGEVAGLVTFNRIKEVPYGERANTPVSALSRPLADVLRTGRDDSVADLLAGISGQPEGRALVFAGDRLVGIVSPADVSRALERTTHPGTAGRASRS